MSKTSLKALTTQNVCSLSKHNDFNKSNLKYTFKLFYLNYIYNLNKFCNIFIFSIFNKQEGKFDINFNFKLVHYFNINKNYLNIKNIYTSLDKITKNKFGFFSKVLQNYSFIYIRYLRDRNSGVCKYIRIKNKSKILKQGFKGIKKNKKISIDEKLNICKRMGMRIGYYFSEKYLDQKISNKLAWLSRKKKKFKYIFKKKMGKNKKFNFLS